MIKIKILNDIKKLHLKIFGSFPKIVLSNNQEKEAIPTKETQEIVPDKEYDGLSKVIIKPIPDEYIIPQGNLEISQNGTYDVTNYASANVNVPEKQLGTKTITKNGIYKATDDNLDGYSEVEVATSGVDINEYFNDTISRITTRDYVGSWQTIIKKFRSPLKINGTDGKFMFYSYPLSEIPTLIGMEKVTDMEMMFSYSYSLTDLDLTNWNTSSARRMKQMFYGCSYLTSLNLSSFNTSNVTTMEGMFGNCSKLINLNISNFDFSKVTSYSNMFGSVPNDCYILVKDATAKEWITSKFTNLTNVHYVGEEG